MFVDFSSINEKMVIYNVTFAIDVCGKQTIQTMQAPRMMIEQQFISFVQQAIQESDTPIKITMSIEFPIYDEWRDKWNEGKNSIIFINNAYKDMHKDEENVD